MDLKSLSKDLKLTERVSLYKQALDKRKTSLVVPTTNYGTATQTPLGTIRSKFFYSK
jgi:hypothetical protein